MYTEPFLLTTNILSYFTAALRSYKIEWVDKVGKQLLCIMEVSGLLHLLCIQILKPRRVVVWLNNETRFLQLQ